MELVAADLEELVTAVKDQRFASSLTEHKMGFGIQQHHEQTSKLTILRKDPFQNFLLILHVS